MTSPRTLVEEFDCHYGSRQKMERMCRFCRRFMKMGVTRPCFQHLSRETDRDGIVYHWQGFKGNISPSTFDFFKDTEIVKVDVGSEHYLFLTREHQVFACGSNDYGQLGIGSPETSYTEPQLVETLSDKKVVDVICGYNHSVAVCENGDLYCWGDSSSGECGVGKRDTVISPEKVEFSGAGFPEEDSSESSNVRVQQVSCGRTHTLALSMDGEIWTWGSGVQLGLEEVTLTRHPILVDRLIGRTVVSICCGEKHSAALVERVSSSTAEQARILEERCESMRRRDSSKGGNDEDLSTCAACDREIFSFTETLDTCIISDKHTCELADASTQESVAPQSVPIEEAKTSQVSQSSANTPDTTAVAGLGTDLDNVEVERSRSPKVTSNTDETFNQSGVPANDQPDNSEKSDGTERSANSPGKSPRKTDTEIEPTMSTGLTEQENQSPVPVEGEIETPVEEGDESPIWKLRPGFETPLTDSRMDSRKSDQTGSTLPSPAGSGTEIGSNSGNSGSPSKTGHSHSTIMNDSAARQFLAKQLGNGTSNKIKDESTPDDHGSQGIHGNEGQTPEPSSSPMMSSFGSMFSSAFSNIKSFVAGDDMDSDDMEKMMGQDLSHATSQQSHESTAKSGSTSVAESSFSFDLSGRPITSQSAQSLNLSPESPRNSKEDLLETELALYQSSTKLSTPKSDPHVAPPSDKSEQQRLSQAKTSEPDGRVTVETEVWTWGKNNKGQLGQGDMEDRTHPYCIKMMSNKNVVKLAAGANHTLALTASSQVYSWGANMSGQLGHTEEGPTPCKVKSLSSYPVWDIAGGQNHSLFLVDSTGFMPDVCYSGKQPSEGVYGPVVKTSKPVGLTFLKKAKAGWVRRVITRGDNCVCQADKNSSGGRATEFELASTERSFNMLLLKIATQFLRPLQKSAFYSSLEVHPYKVSLLTLLDSFMSLTRKIGRSSVELTLIIREGGDIMTARIIDQFENFIAEFKKYSRAFNDFLAVGGFEYCTKHGSQFFEKIQTVYQDLLDLVLKNNHARNFLQVLQLPFDRLKEYSRLANKLTLNYPTDSKEGNLLVKCCLNWDHLKNFVVNDQKQAENTRVFWDTWNNRLVESLRVPKRRMLKDSKVHPLTLQTAGRFSAHLFFLFNDTFVHVQGNSLHTLPLSIIWVETPSESDQLQNAIVVTSPEDTLTLCATSPADKAEWLMALNQAINKVLSNQRSRGRHGSADRLTPPLIRHATYTFAKNVAYKDATYKGFWMSGKMNGQGELKWPDGRKYAGHFKQGFQHGHGTSTVPKPDGEESLEGNWKEGRMHGYGTIRYSNRDRYEGYLKEGMRFGHGVFKQGRHTSTDASIYIGEWLADRRHGYGVLDDVLKGEKYMGLWQEDCRHGNGIVVTLDGMYFEGNFSQNKMTGFGIMLTDDNSCYEGDFSGITQLSGKGVLTMPNGDWIEGSFSGSWNEGLRVNGVFNKNTQSMPTERKSFSHDIGIKSSNYGKLSVKAEAKWNDIFSHCSSVLGFNGVGKADTSKAWEVVAVLVSSGRQALKEKQSSQRTRYRIGSLEELEKIPPYNKGQMTIEYYEDIRIYLLKAFDTPFHPLGKLIEALVDVFRATYIGVGAHPRLLHHAVEEIVSFVRRIYQIVRILFPDLPHYGGPKSIFSETRSAPDIPKSTDEVLALLQQAEEMEDGSQTITPAGLLHPILLPKVYPPLFDLYALFNDKDDERYWERVEKLNRQGDMALMAYLGIDQKYWLIEESMFSEKRESLSSMKDQCYANAVDTLQRLSTAFSPAEKLRVIEQTFYEISQAVHTASPSENVWCMDDLFPIFQFVVVRSKIRHLGAEIHMVDDLMESHLELGELGIMFTTLKACYFQIQNEKLPNH